MKLFDDYNRQELEAYVSFEEEAYFLPPDIMHLLADSADCAEQCCTCGEMSFCYGCGCCMSCCTGDYDMWTSIRIFLGW